MERCGRGILEARETLQSGCVFPLVFEKGISEYMSETARLN
jgi:hypothetical protein